MSLIALVSLKASPGTTTAALAMAHVWPGSRDVLLIEADPAGGDIAARLGVPADPGLATLAAAGRRAMSPQVLQDNIRSIAGIPTLLGPPNPAASVAALKTVGAGLAHAASQLNSDVLVDCGRIQPESPASPLIERADLVMLVARPTVAEVPRIRAWASETAKGNRCLLLSEANHSDRESLYPAEEVAEVVGIPVAGVLPDEPRAAARLWGAPGNPKSLERSALITAARGAAANILLRLGTAPAEARTLIGQDMSRPLLRRVVQGVRQ